MKNIEGKIYLISKIVISFIISFTFFLDSIISDVPALKTSVSLTYYKDITVYNYLILIVSFIALMIIFQLLEKLVDFISSHSKFSNKEKKKNIKVYFIIYGVILVCWLPYLLTYFPGGIFSDTQNSILQVLNVVDYKNSNPLLYTIIIGNFVKFGIANNNPQLGISIFSVLQSLSMIGLLSYFVYWLYKKNVNKYVLIAITIFFSLFQLFPLYSVSIWKDTPFSLALFAFTLFIADIVLSKGEMLKKKKNVIKYALYMLLVAFLRLNGLYTIIFFTLVFVFIYRKKSLLFNIVSISTVVLILIINGPLFDKMGLNEKEPLPSGIKIQQILYVKVKNGNITESQDELLHNVFLDYDELNRIYTPTLFDMVFNNPNYDKHSTWYYSKDVNKLWLELFKTNPRLYIEEFFLQNIGFWDYKYQFHDAYVSNFMWPDTKEIFGIEQHDLIKEMTGVSIKEHLEPKRLYSAAIFLIVMLISIVITIYKRNYYNLIIYLPALLLYGSVFVATPIAFSMRYVYIMVLVTPLNIVLPFMKADTQEKMKKLKNKRKK